MSSFLVLAIPERSWGLICLSASRREGVFISPSKHIDKRRGEVIKVHKDSGGWQIAVTNLYISMSEFRSGVRPIPFVNILHVFTLIFHGASTHWEPGPFNDWCSHLHLSQTEVKNHPTTLGLTCGQKLHSPSLWWIITLLKFLTMAPKSRRRSNQRSYHRNAFTKYLYISVKSKSIAYDFQMCYSGQSAVLNPFNSLIN